MQPWHLGLAGLLSESGPAATQTWPSNPIRIIVPFPPEPPAEEPFGTLKQDGRRQRRSYTHHILKAMSEVWRANPNGKFVIGELRYCWRGQLRHSGPKIIGFDNFVDT